MKSKNIALLLILSLLFVQVPALSIENKDVLTAGTEKTQYINQNWWDSFNDPYLTEYIVKTAESNYDIKINELKTLIAKEGVKEAFGKELPQISFNPNVNRQKYTGSIPYAGMFFPSYYSSSIYFPLNANYELDIWLKNRTYTKKVKKEYDATKFDEKAQFISLTTLTASTYINIICLDQKVLLQEELVKTRKEIFDLITINFEYGLNSSIDVTDAEQRYVESMTELENLKQNRSVLLNQLAVLVGGSSENSSSITRGSLDEIRIPKNLPETVSTEIINKRPDILKTEAELEAAALDVKLARKAFLPSLNLTGFLGFNAYAMSRLFDWQSFVINGAAGLAQNIFTGGQLKARLRAKKYNYDAMLNSYQKTILTSVQEVNDSLVNIKSDETKYSNYTKRTMLGKSKYNDINYKYKKGALSYLDTLKFKENLLVLEKDQTQSKTEYLISVLSLYKSVGGQL